MPVVLKYGSRVIELVGHRDEIYVVRLLFKPFNISGLAFFPTRLLVVVVRKAVGQSPHHPGNFGPEVVFNILESWQSAVILHSVMEKGRDHHVFSHRNTRVT